VNTWKVILATMVIFAAGVVTGGFLVRHIQGPDGGSRPRSPASSRVAQPVSAGGMRFEFLRRIQRDLDLTPEQRERVDKILKESQERARKIMEPVAPEMRLEIQRTKQEFREVLTADQQARFDQLLKHQPHLKDQRHLPTTNGHLPTVAVATNSP
jgi:hypothetical protein